MLKKLLIPFFLLILFHFIDTRISSSSRGSSSSRSSSSSRISSSSSTGSRSSSPSISSSRGSSASRTSSSLSSSLPKTNSILSSSSTNQDQHSPTSGISASNGISSNSRPNYPYYQAPPISTPLRSTGSSNLISRIGGAAIGSGLGSSVFRHNNRNYYGGATHHSNRQDRFMCSMNLEILKTYTNGTCYDANTNQTYQVPDYNQVILNGNVNSSDEITWSCKTANETCCCATCCPKQS